MIETKEQAEQFEAKKDEKFFIVSQTTFNYKKFQDVVEIFKERGYNGSVVNTVCNATEVRQVRGQRTCGTG